MYGIYCHPVNVNISTLYKLKINKIRSLRTNFYVLMIMTLKVIRSDNHVWVIERQ